MMRLAPIAPALLGLLVSSLAATGPATAAPWAKSGAARVLRQSGIHTLFRRGEFSGTNTRVEKAAGNVSRFEPHDNFARDVRSIFRRAVQLQRAATHTIVAKDSVTFLANGSMVGTLRVSKQERAEAGLKDTTRRTTTVVVEDKVGESRSVTMEGFVSPTDPAFSAHRALYLYGFQGQALSGVEEGWVNGRRTRVELNKGRKTAYKHIPAVEVLQRLGEAVQGDAPLMDALR